MEKLEKVLQSRGVDVSSLEPWVHGYRLTIPRGKSISTWLELRSLVPRTGHWPVLSDPADLEELGDERDYDPRSVAQIIEAARSIDPVERIAPWRRAKVGGLEAGLQGEGAAGERAGADAIGDESSFEVDEDFPRGPWPGETGPGELVTTLERDWMRLDEVAVLLLPAAESWHVPAHLNFGDWNDCPKPEEHVAIFEYWYRRHEAEVMTVTHDVVEMRVGRPPRSREEAIALAMEQYRYCGDIVDQGTETIDQLAASLLGSPVWYFWWD
jgi:hypothetical protein